MSTYQINPIADYRNEGWALTGGSSLNAVWSSVSDSNYASNPGNKGRAAVTFPLDISSSNIPDGCNIESVSIYVRAERTDTTSRRLTINILPLDRTSCFHSRTIAVSQTITTYQVGTYTKDALNRSWTKDTLNQLVVQAFTYDSSGNTDKIRVYELYAVVNFRTKPTVSITAPSGTVSTSAPVVSFTYSQSDGDIQAYATYKIYTADQVAGVTFNPDVTPSAYPASSKYTVKSGDSLWAIAARFYGNGELWPTLYAASTLRSGDPNLIYPGEIVTVPGIGVIQGDITSFTLPFALTAGNYFIFVEVTSTRGATSAWDSRSFTVGGGGSGNPGSPGGSLGGIGTGGGGGFESVIADGPTSNVYVALRDGSNLMGVHQSDFETLMDSTNTWVGTNCTVAQDLTVHYSTGGASMKVTASSAANMSVASSWIEVAAGAPLTLRAQALTIVTARTINASIAFVDDTFTSVGSPSTTSITDATTTWTEAVLTSVTVPAGATMCQVTLQVVSPANAEVHNFDHIGLMYGTNSAWSNGGHASRNLLTSYQSNAENPAADPAWTSDSASTVTRVATTGTGSDGTSAFKITYNGTASSISYVATSTAFTSTTPSSSVTLNKPAGVANGDVLIAYIGVDGGVVTTAPTGWSIVDTAFDLSGSAMSVLMRDGLAADPSTWTANLSFTATRIRTVVVAYRGAAPTASQFSRENMSTSISGSQVAQTPVVNNADGNAWRLSAFVVNDNVTGGSMTANITPASTPQPIAYVSRGTAHVSGASSSFTINKPSGTINGDFMVASLVVADLGSSVSAPSGWTILDNVHSSTGYGDTWLVVMYRFAGASEPTSWTGSLTGGSATHACSAVSYRNVNTTTPWLAHGAQVDNTATFSTPSKTNTISNSWWVAAFGDVTNGGSSVSGSGTERTDDTNGGGIDRASNLSIHDSGGAISTGSQQATAAASNDYNLYSSAAWIGILNATTTGVTPGANETERQDAVAGSSNPWIDLAVYDSNGVASTGNTTVYGTFTPGSGSGTTSSVGFLGFLSPGTASVSGEAGCTLSNYVDLRNISPIVMSAVGNTVSLEVAALGSVSGTPHMKLYAYSGNELLSSQVQEGTAFNTSTWTTSILKFIVPTGTTRLLMGVSMINCNVSDYMLFDRVQLALGSTNTYRVGTGSTAHPIFNQPMIEYAEDLGTGYGDWTPLNGSGGTPFSYDPDTSLCAVIDQTMTPLSRRKYRAYTVSYGLAGDKFVSPYGPESLEVTMVASDWWLKDMTNQALSMKLKVYLDSDSTGATGGTGSTFTTSDTTTAFQPLGRSRPVVVTEGYKGDVIPVVLIMTSQEFAQLQELFAQRHTLYLQSNIDKAWWVRPAGDLVQAIQPTSQLNTNPLRFITVTFIEVDPAV